MLRLLRRRAPRERIYLLAVAGYPNFGDEAITRSWLRWLARHRPDAEVWLDTPDPSGASVLHHHLHPHLVVVDTLHRLARESIGSGRERRDRLRAVLDEPWHAPRWITGVEAFQASRHVHLLGGGYLTAQGPEFVPLLGALSWARAHGARTGATGLGLLPVSAELGELWLETADDLDVLTVRDAASVEVTGGRARLAPDDVFLGGVDQHLDLGRRDLPDTVVLVQDDGHDRFEPVRRLVERTLDAWDADQVLFVEANPPSDFRIVEALRPRFPDAPFVSFREVARDGLPAGPGQRWLTTRYHPHLLAAAAGAAGVAITVNDYYGVKHEAVTAMGSAWTVVSDAGSTPQPGPAGDLPQRSADHAYRLEAVARELYA